MLKLGVIFEIARSCFQHPIQIENVDMVDIGEAQQFFNGIVEGLIIVTGDSGANIRGINNALRCYENFQQSLFCSLKDTRGCDICRTSIA